MTAEPTRVLAEGTLKYLGAKDGGSVVDWMTARVFVIDYLSATGGSAYVVVVAREPMYLPYRPVPAPVGSLHRLPAYDESDDGYVGEGDLLTLDVEALVPA